LLIISPQKSLYIINVCEYISKFTLSAILDYVLISENPNLEEQKIKIICLDVIVKNIMRKIKMIY